MLPKLEKIFVNLSSSIAVKREISPYMDYPLHYHPEYEIIYVEKSYGIRLMGNNISNFGDGDLMFIGKNLPHVWKNDKDFYKDNKDLQVDVYVIHFMEDALKEGFFNLPELEHINRLFALGQQGVLIKGKHHKGISEMVKKVYNSSGFERLVNFLQTLNSFAMAEEFELLSSTGYANSINVSDTERINTVMDYLMDNFDQDIKLQEVANLINLNKSSFCRYFRSKTNKTCSEFLNEIRVGHACKLLVNNDMSIGQICYEIGYNNISHFNRQFKSIIGMTAKEYSRKYLKHALNGLPKA